MSRTELVEVIKAANTLGEGIQWNAVDGCAWWTDIQCRRLHRWRPASTCVESFAVPERVGCFAFTESDDLIVAFASGIARHHLGNHQTEWLARPAVPLHGRRFNDGRADRQGRFWAGTMVEDPQAAPPDSAALYCLDESGTLTSRIGGIQIANGLCFSPDSRYCYFADSPRRMIFRFDFDADTGQLGTRCVFAESPAGGFPDGATVDSDGCVWSAHWGSGQVIRYDPRGRIDRRVTVPTRQPSCAAFGGQHLDLLLVTSAREGLSAAALSEDSMAGHLFVFRTGSTGLAEPRYRGHKTESACASRPATT